MFEDGFKQRAHIGAVVFFFQFGKAGEAGSVNDGEIELLVAGAQFVEQFKCLVDHPARARARFVDFVDHHNRAQAQRQGFFGHKTGLRHRAFLRIHQQHHAIDHAQHALHFAAEIGVSGGVDDIDVVAFVFDGGVFGQNGDAALFFDVAAVHHALVNVLVAAEGA